MSRVLDPSTREASQARLKLAGDLVFVPQVHFDEVYYHLESKAKNAFYRIGYPEYVFVSLLNGKLTIAQALTVMARRMGKDALSKLEGMQICNWLLQNGLAEDLDQESLTARSAKETPRRIGTFNPFWIKVPFGCPDRLLTCLLPPLAWLFSWWATLLGTAAILFGAACISAQWERFAASAETIFAPNNWLWLGLAWLGLKTAHELAHGIVCRSYGGEVREAGAIFVLFAPLAYVDVTSSWRFTSKWQRIHVAAAGMYAEVVIASIAAIAWTYTDTIYAQHLLHCIIVMASLSTLLFNANPLMKFDGYYILSDIAEIPNLAAEGSQFVRQATSRVFYGTQMPPVRLAGFRCWFVRIYGVAAAVWRVLICLSLAMAASVLLQGAGIILSIIALLLWFGRPAWELARELFRRAHTARAKFVRAMLVAVVLASAATCTSTYLPWPGAMTAPVIVDYSDLSILRSGADGFVNVVHIENGQSVTAGQLLVELRNEELATELRCEELSLEQERVRHRQALQRQDAAAAQIASQNMQALQERITELQHRVENLRIVAPRNGRILGRNLRFMSGTYVREGEEVLAIGDDRYKELVVSIGQEEIDAMTPRVGQDVTYRIDGQTKRHGVLKLINPRASTRLPHAALSSGVGGPLVVRRSSEQDGAAPGDSQYRLTEPRFRGVISLPVEVAVELGAGEQGYALIGLRRESIGEVALIKISRWLEELFHPARS